MIIALSGGVGGARFAEGLAQVVGQDLTVIVNTADDFIHLGLPVSPDIDTVVYTLAGIADFDRGWGLAGETWNFLDQLDKLGGPTWFRLGDRDLATHILRGEALGKGRSLTEVTDAFCKKLGVTARVLPMTDDSVSTMVIGAEGEEIEFQDYFVRRQCAPSVRGFRFAGIEHAAVTSEVANAFGDPDLHAIFVGPSNPFVSVAPILAIPGMRAHIEKATVPVVAVSPIIGGAAVKGPAAKMMAELGLEVSALAVARHYDDLLSGIVIDQADAGLASAIEALGIAVLVTDTLMRAGDDRRRLVSEALAFADRIRGAGP